MMKNVMIKIVLLLGVLLLGSCSKDTDLEPGTFEVGEAFELRANQTMTDAAENLSVEIISVIEDSRCPINAQCVWVGQTKVDLQIIDAGQTTNKELIYQAGTDLPLVVGSYVYRLTKVTPEALGGEVIDIEDYVFTLLIEKI